MAQSSTIGDVYKTIVNSLQVCLLFRVDTDPLQLSLGLLVPGWDYLPLEENKNLNIAYQSLDDQIKEIIMYKRNNTPKSAQVRIGTALRN